MGKNQTDLAEAGGYRSRGPGIATRGIGMTRRLGSMALACAILVSCGEEATESQGLAALATGSAWESVDTGNSRDVAWADFDHDGDLDLAVAFYGEPNRIYENVGGVLQNPAVWESAEGDETTGLAWGDWNGDGFQDLASSNATGEPNRVYTNIEGVLETTASWFSTDTDYGFAVAWADYDDDGDLDLAVAHHGQADRIYINDAATALSTTAGWVASVADETKDLAWGDWDGDGYPELATGADNFYGDNRVYSNGINGLETTPSWSAAEGDATYAVEWGDWDGDGDLDLAAGNAASSLPRPIRIYTNSGSSLPTTAAWSTSQVSSSYDSNQEIGLDWGDWDGDGDLDLAASNETGQYNRVWVNTGASSLSPDWQSNQADTTYRTRWADQDGDGDMDIAVAGGSGVPSRVYENEGVGLAFEQPLEDGTTNRVALGDCDGDGDLDLALADSAGGPIRLYTNGDGTFSAAPFATETEETISVAWGDWDGDGDLDLAAGNSSQPNRVYSNDGCVFTPAWSSSETENTSDVAWGDVDGDGDLDLAAINNGQASRVYLNDGTCGTSPATCLSSSSGWAAADPEGSQGGQWIDFDLDGDLDLSVVNYPGVNRIYVNDGSCATSLAGCLASGWVSDEDEASLELDWADSDGDGWPELAVANYGFALNRIYDNGPNGLATAGAPISAEADYSHALAWGDRDGDGDPDLFVGNDSGAPSRLYQNNGGVLALVWSEALGPNGTADATWGDLDADGDLDLVLGNALGLANRTYLNHRITDPLLPNNPTYPVVGNLGTTAVAASGYYSAEVLTGDTVTVPFTLYDAEGDAAPSVRLEWSRTDGQWFDATLAATSGPTTNLEASADGVLHSLEWDAATDRAYGDSLRVRVIVEWQNPMFITHPMQHGALSAVSPAFRYSVCFPLIDVDGDGFNCAEDCDDDLATSLVRADDPDCDGSAEDMSVEGMALLALPAGTFEMGCTASQSPCEDSESPSHQVTLTNGFWLGETEVTQGQWQALMGTNPSYFGPNGGGPACGLDCPVELVNWYEAAAFANALSTSEGLTTCYTLDGPSGTLGGGCGVNDYCATGTYTYSTVTVNPATVYECEGYRLPTEAEWEYAARAGTDLYQYAGSNTLGDVAWSSSNTTHPGATKLPNDWGLYDLSGNVFEPAWDWYATSYLSSDPDTNPEGPGPSFGRVVRGGAWSYGAAFARVAFRGDFGPYERASTTGFRLARTIPPAAVLPDADEDGSPLRIDCDDSDDANFPGNPEICDGQDNDCDAEIDEGVDEDLDGLPCSEDCNDTDPTSTALADDPDCDGLAEDMTVQGMDMLVLPAGPFEMGCASTQPDCGIDESPVHGVTLTRDFWMSQTEVTQGQWQAQMGSNPSYFGPNGGGPDCGPHCPLELVNWYEALEFANAMSAAEGLPACYVLSGCTGALGAGCGSSTTCTSGTYVCSSLTLSGPSVYDCEGYRLPTDAEWEYAARAGGDQFEYSGSSAIDDVAWYDANSGSVTHAVGMKAPNSWGFDDMSGNLWEWAADWYSTTYYSSSPNLDPPGPETGTARVVRGGGWGYPDIDARVASRGGSTPALRHQGYGFRLARTVPALPLDADSDDTPAAEDCDDQDASSTTVATDADCDGAITADDCDDNDAASLVVADDPDCDGIVGDLVVQGIDMLVLPNGTFEMGCTTSQSGCNSDESPAHDVTLTNDFWMSSTEVTQGQWQGLMGTNPSYFGSDGGGADCGLDCPVELVDWYEAAAFANALSAAEGLPACYTLSGCTGTLGAGCGSSAACTSGTYVCTSVTVNSPTAYECAGYRLPMEAEWEYAARAGTDLYLYAGSDAVDDVAWYDGNSGAETHAVAQLQANAWGLFDMSGNAWEWSWDRYGGYLSSDPVEDPEGPATGDYRPIRGGNWASPPAAVRVARRNNGTPGNRGSGIGFRVARTIPDAADFPDEDGDGSPLRIDCDDSDDANFPGNPEVCDGQDNDCDGEIDEGVDEDVDGYGCAEDCDDADPNLIAIADDPDCDGVVSDLLDVQGMLMRVLPGGTFEMGCTPSQWDSPADCQGPETPVHTVELTNDFWMSETEVTQAQWQALMASNPSFNGPNGFRSECGLDCPVERVNWFEALEFANAVSLAEGLPACYSLTGCGGDAIGDGCGPTNLDVNCDTGNYSCSTVVVNADSVYDCAGYRLPTEAEWEYAARAGTDDYMYAGSDNIDLVAWYASNSGSVVHPVRQKLPNDFDLYDMSGNLFEWAWDWFGFDYYDDLDGGDPTGPIEGDPNGPLSLPGRVERGGRWGNTAATTRIASRGGLPPINRDYDLGIRLVRTVPVVASLLDADEDGSPFRADCDDADAANFPANPEVCDGQDNDCDGAIPIDEIDADSDLWMLCAGDCDDANIAINPSATETCDAIDNDCDADVDEGFDTDGDGQTTCAGDCDDTNAAINSSATEICDGQDNDCDAEIDDGFDVDGDGQTSCAGDCDDSDPTINTSASETCDAIDSDCDGSLVDEFANLDGDGEPDCIDLDDDGDSDPDTSDCAPLDASVFTGAPETCDAVDSDCDGSLVDEFDNLDGDPEPDCIDLDDDGDSDPDTSDCAPLDDAIYTGAPETCDAIDSDCDGSLVDEFDNFDGDSEPDCIDLDDDGDSDPDTSDCAPLDDAIYTGAPETCDAIDSDCDGSLVDEFADFDLDLYPDCTDPDDDNDDDPDPTDCNDADASVFTGAPESCDAIDSDCDGSLVDEFPNFDGDSEPDCIDLDDDNDFDEDSSDCNDADASIYTGAPETCDAIDSDCDGSLVDEFDNFDGDSEPDCIDTDDDDDSSLDINDCDDFDANIYPGAPELCDAIDSDCDGSLVDEFPDLDGDLDPDCTDPDDDDDGDGDATDCEPLDAAIYTDAPETCDLIDSDCDGSLVDEFLDADGDGTPDCADDDVDGDGFTPFDGDCNDDDDLVYPGAPETCDDVDSDCDGSLVDEFPNSDTDAEPDCIDEDDDGDGSLDGDDCEPLDSSIHPAAPEICDTIDSDCDGSLVDEFDDLDADLEPDCTDTDDDGDGSLDGDDCAPLDDTIYPLAPELCDDLDNDCDGALSGEELDDDADGQTECDGDCADDDPARFTGNPELCDQADNDCDDVVPSDELDDDSDGFAECEGDCDDAEPLAYPGALEVCDDLIDNDCDGTADVVIDEDGDGYTGCGGDCDDSDAAVHPGALEQCNGEDDDCDDAVPADEVDADSDGHRVCAGDCDDSSNLSFPGASELCDGLDNDCEGAVPAIESDTDADSSRICDGDCDDADPNSYPSAPELCDGADNDCDGALPADEADLDTDTVMPCAGDCDDTTSTIGPTAPELCDALDNDCDGALPADEADLDGDAVMACQGDCDDTDAAVYAGAPELCDGLDNDCDGADLDEEADSDGDGISPCDGDCDDADPDLTNLDEDEDGTSSCDGDCDDTNAELNVEDEDDDGQSSCEGDCDDYVEEVQGIDADGDSYSICTGDCDDEDAAVYPGAPLDCDGVNDNDCDGETDSDSADADFDTYSECDGDCDDADPAVHPGADPVCDDGVDDNNCDGALDANLVDDDGDGFTECELDCDDTNAAVYPFAPEICDEVDDNDCDGVLDSNLIDNDGDGYTACEGDCDDGSPAAYPDAPELCDAIDNNCDDATDLDNTDLDADEDGWLICEGDCDDNNADLNPDAEDLCDDGVDSDCNGFGGSEDGAVEEPECWDLAQPEACRDCSGELAAGDASGWPTGLLLLGLFTRRRRTPREGVRR